MMIDLQIELDLRSRFVMFLRYVIYSFNCLLPTSSHLHYNIFFIHSAVEKITLSLPL